MSLELDGITVRFGPVTAVDGVFATVRPGTVHAVVGENGAGKTTLMKVAFGMVEPERGRIRLDGVEHRWRSPRDAIAAGIGMVHQHFMLQDAMTVLENVVLCHEPAGRWGWVRFSEARARLAPLAAAFGLDVDPDMPVARLSMGERQMVEILKSLYLDSRILILDEPTAVLTDPERDALFAALRRLRAEGRAVVLITHKIDEVLEIADEVTVMRGGRLISSRPRAEVDRATLTEEIVGRALAPRPPRRPAEPGPVLLALDGVAVAPRPQPVGPITLELRGGEIMGIAGVAGNGQALLVEAVVGLRPLATGRVRIAGVDVSQGDVARRRAAGLSYIPEDRQRVGLALGASVAENASVGRLDEPGFRRGPFLSARAMRDHARRLISDHAIRVAGPEARAATMSGGNKQKLVVARELDRDTPVVVVENPTWGVDVGAIEAIHARLLALRDRGRAVLLISSELDEILALSDRVAVMQGGRIAGELSGAAVTRAAVGALMVSSDARRHVA